MRLDSPIYGSWDITEPVLVDLLASNTIQRLKGISQGGVPFQYCGTHTCSRYDHSVGVMLILRKVGASVEEQAAGLLHDASHTAFSHVADVVFGHTEKEDFQDLHHEQYLARSDAADILRKYGFDFDRIADCHQFSLLEQDAPALCADRADYTLHELLVAFGDNAGKVARCAQSIIAVDGKLCFNNIEEATYFSKGYVKAQDEHWGGQDKIVRYALFSEVLKAAIKRKILTMDDFWVDDVHCMDKILRSGADDLLARLLLLEGTEKFSVVTDSLVNESCFEIAKKLRWIDPMVYLEDKKSCVQLSSVLREYKELLAAQRARYKPKEYVLVDGWLKGKI